MKVRLDLEVDEQTWLRIAVINGFVRENPKFTWKDKEKKEAIKFALALQIKDWERK